MIFRSITFEYHDGLCHVGAHMVKQALFQPSLFQAQACTPESR